MTDEERELHIDFGQFRECIETWSSSESRGFRLYSNEDLNSGPTDEYVLVEYDWSNEDGVIKAMGRADIVPVTPDKQDVNEQLEQLGLTQLSNGQWNTVEEAYNELATEVIRDKIIDGVPQLHRLALYYEFKDLQQALEYRLDRVHRKIESFSKSDGKYHEAYGEYDRLGDDQYYNIAEVIESTIEWERSDIVPYVRSCQVAAHLDFEPYEQWELRAIEHLHSGIFVNKPELAKTKALIEAGFTQSEIADKLGKERSTVSKEVASVNNLESRADWSVKQ